MVQVYRVANDVVGSIRAMVVVMPTVVDRESMHDDGSLPASGSYQLLDVVVVAVI